MKIDQGYKKTKNRRSRRKKYNKDIDERRINNYWKWVEENKNKLLSCDGPHEFVLMENKISKIDILVFRRFKCSKCGGIMEGPHYEAYKHGLVHGRAVDNVRK